MWGPPWRSKRFCGPNIAPFLLMLGALFVVGGSDLRRGLAALGGVAVYYIGLWFFRGKLERDIVFKITKAK